MQKNPGLKLSIKGTFFREFNCDICKADAQAFLDVLTSEEAINAIVMGLSGPGFCQDPSLGLSEEQVAGCQGFIKAFMPAAMKTLFVDNPPSAESICDRYFDQCSTQEHFWWMK